MFGGFLGGDGMFGGGFLGGLGAGPQEFCELYRCYPVSFVDKTHLEEGDKILMPPSALDTLARLHIDYPMLFELTNDAHNRRTHCGVLEFSAPEGTCYLPYWMMQNLLVSEGDLLQVKNATLPKATFVKFRPMSTEFLQISNPRAVLENEFRKFSCVTVGDQLCFRYNGKNYYMEVREVKPKDAASIIETDCEVDFEPPPGYVEPSRDSFQASSSAEGHPSDSARMVGGTTLAAVTAMEGAMDRSSFARSLSSRGAGALSSGDSSAAPDRAPGGDAAKIKWGSGRRLVDDGAGKISVESAGASSSATAAAESSWTAAGGRTLAGTESQTLGGGATGAAGGRTLGGEGVVGHVRSQSAMPSGLPGASAAGAESSADRRHTMTPSGAKSSEEASAAAREHAVMRLARLRKLSAFGGEGRSLRDGQTKVPPQRSDSLIQTEEDRKDFVPFKGSGNRLR